MFCCTLLNVHSSFAIILILQRERELIALLSLSSWCLVMFVYIFFAVPWVCLWFVIVFFADLTHLLFFSIGIDFKILTRGKDSTVFN